MSALEETKICTKCQQIKPYSEFYRDSSRNDGLCVACKACKRLYGKRYYSKNPEKVAAAHRRLRDADPDKFRARQRRYREKYRENNREKVRLSQQQYREKCKMSALEETLLWQIKAMQLPMPVREYEFAPPRKWRSDFCFVQYKILVECEGGEFIRGRHQRPAGYANDCEKYNAAQLLGFKVLRFTGSQIKKGIAIQTIKYAIDGH